MGTGCRDETGSAGRGLTKFATVRPNGARGEIGVLVGGGAAFGANNEYT